MEIEKYGRNWAVYDGADLVCVTVYKKGANEVVRRLEKRGVFASRTAIMRGC